MPTICTMCITSCIGTAPWPSMHVSSSVVQVHVSPAPPLSVPLSIHPSTASTLTNMNLHASMVSDARVEQLDDFDIISDGMAVMSTTNDDATNDRILIEDTSQDAASKKRLEWVTRQVETPP
eukprot:1110062_1